MTRLTLVLWLLMAMTIPTVVSAPGPSPTLAQTGGAEPRRGGILRVAMLGNIPRALHPYPEPRLNTSSLSDALALMTSGLLDFDWETLDYTVHPDTSMAASLPTVSPNGRTYTFTLRNDIQWSDGHPITSADFVFAWENASKEENDFVGLDDLKRIDSYQAPDPRTIVVTLKEPLARYLGVSTASTIFPVPQHVWKERPWADPTSNPEIVTPTVVSGPFLPNEVSVNRLVFVRNEAFWGKKPLLAEVHFIPTSPSLALDLLRNREVEWLQTIPPFDISRTNPFEYATVLTWVPVNAVFRDIEFNLRRPILADKRVREALARSVDRAELADFESTVPQYSVVPSTNTRWFADGVERYDYDPDKARSLLRDADFIRDEHEMLQDAVGGPVRLEVITPATSAPRLRMAEYLSQQWARLGIDVSVARIEFSTFVERTYTGSFDIALGTWSSGLDPDGLKTWFSSDGPQNITGYLNPRVDELLARGRVEQDEAARRAIYDELQRIVIDDLPIYPVTTAMAGTAFDKRVQGVSISRSGDLMTSNNMQILSWYVADE
jgi:peptide/nickel transport system substrate-binding protein